MSTKRPRSSSPPAKDPTSLASEYSCRPMAAMSSDCDSHAYSDPHPIASLQPSLKKSKPSHSALASATSRTKDTARRPDRLSALSDELLIRILYLLPVECVLICQAVSHRFHRLAGDAQVWKGLYWERWVRPRVRMLPRSFAGEGRESEREREREIGGIWSRKSKWLDEGRFLLMGEDGGNGMRSDSWERSAREGTARTGGLQTQMEDGRQEQPKSKGVSHTDWKARYKLRHNWSIGAAEVREIRLGLGLDPTQFEAEDEMAEDHDQRGKILMARLVDGGVVTVDIKDGLRAWDIKRRECVAGPTLASHDDDGRVNERVPTCLSVDNGSEGGLQTAVVIGFQDGGFEIWRLRLDVSVGSGSFERQYQSPVLMRNEVDMDRNVQLSAVAYAHPYLLTITANHLLSLYVFDADMTAGGKDLGTMRNSSTTQEAIKENEILLPDPPRNFEKWPVNSKASAPRLLTSLKSHTCWPPLCLSIRYTPQTIIASIAYSLPTYLSGWSVGLQELHLTRSGTILRSRLASAVEQGFHSLLSSSAPSTPSLSQSLRPSTPSASDYPSRNTARHEGKTHHMSLSYSHPYLLVGNRDNTLSLYLVTSNNEDLKISKSTTLWGHTSSISGAHVGGRGKAVSVSARGEELRIWELEGGLGRKVVQERSVLVRREEKERRDGDNAEGADEDLGGGNPQKAMSYVEQRKGWVGFNDEVVIVLKEEGQKGQALVVYDFT